MRSVPLDGICLVLHGSMGVEGMHDPEGDILEAIRLNLGNDIPIGVTFDLHANLTQAKEEYATFIIGYKTNPHRDFYNTGYTCGKLLIQTIRGEIKPVMTVRKMRLLKGGGMTIDFMYPMRKIFAVMNRLELKKEVLNVSTFMVQPWLDDPELGWATVAVTDNDPVLAAKTAEYLAELSWSVRDVKHKEGLTPSEAIRIVKRRKLARLLGTFVVCDSADAVGAGAPGESTWILKALLEEGPELISYIPIRDEKAASLAYGKNLTDTVTLSVGGKLDKIYNSPVEITGEVIHKSMTQLGKTVILKSRGIHLILTELPTMTRVPGFFTDLGLKLRKADLIVVKNLFPFRFTFLRYNRGTLDVLTPGTTTINVFELKYKYIPRPIYPLDAIDSWRVSTPYGS